MSRAPRSKLAKRSPNSKTGKGALFDPAAFLATAAPGREISAYSKRDIIFSQGDAADAVFYIKKGKVKVAVLSELGKEAVVALLGPDEFVGEGCLIGQPKRLATASAMTECETMRVTKSEIQRVIHDEPAFSEMFVSHVLARNARVRRRLGRSALQLNRKAACTGVTAVGQFWKGGSAGANSREDQSGGTR